MQRPLTAGLTVFALLVLAPTFAWAHAGHGHSHGGGGLVDGLLHPISGLDHLVAMLAVGLWGAQLGAPLLWVLPVAFPLLMAAGGALALVGVPLPGVEVGIAASAVVLGLAITAAWKAPKALALVLVAAFALFHGHAHGGEIPSAANPVAYSLGFVVATGLIHLGGILIGELRRWRPRGPLCLRGLGALVTGCGVFFLFNALG